MIKGQILLEKNDLWPYNTFLQKEERSFGQTWEEKRYCWMITKKLHQFLK